MDNLMDELVVEDDREMLTDDIISMDECRVCGAPMYVFDGNDICIGCSEEISEVD